MVFKAMDEQLEYNEQNIKEQFSDKHFVHHFHVIKNYLKNLILKSLRNFHHQSSKEGEVKDILKNVEILYDKELYNMIGEELLRAEKIASEYELLESQLEILNWRRRVGQLIDPQDYKIVRRTIQKQQEVLSLIENKLAYYHLISEVAAGIYENTSPVDSEYLLEDINNAKTFESKILHLNAAYFKEVRDNRGEEGVKRLSEFVQMLGSIPNRILESPGMYVSTVNNLISYEIFNKNISKASERITSLKAFYTSIKAKKKTKSLLRQISRTYNLELEVIRSSTSSGSLRPQILEIEEFVIKNKSLMPRDYLISFQFQLASIFFLLADFDRALKWINTILDVKEYILEVLVHSRFLNLMIHYEKSNVFVLRYFVDSTRRFINKSKASHPFYSILLRFFSKIGRAPVLEHQKYFLDLLENFKILEQTGEFPTADLDYVNYKSWAESKVS